MKTLNLAVALATGAVLITSCAHRREKEKVTEYKEEPRPTLAISHANVSELIEAWPESSKAAANSMITQYGLPQEATSELLVWNDTAPFKRSKVYREEVTHNFPVPHTDVLGQVIDYRIPPEKVDEIVKFDGSLIYDRTKGELTARCDKEEMNVLALNLADEIIKGKKSVEEARLEFARSASAFAMGNTNQYTTALMFTPASETADPDRAVDLKSPRIRRGMEAQEAMEAEEAQDTIDGSSESMDLDSMEEEGSIE